MPTIKNPNFDPNDPNSKRFIEQPVEPTGTVSIVDPFANNQGGVEIVDEITPLGGVTIAGAQEITPAPTGLPTPAPVPAPVAEVQKRIFRRGQDIFDADTQRILTPEEFERDFSGRAIEVQAPAERPVVEEAPVEGEIVGDLDQLQTLVQGASRAGLSLEDTMKLITAQTGATPEEKEEIRNRLGIPGLIDEAFTPPSKQTQEIYTQAFNQSGLPKLKRDIADLDEQMKTIRDQASNAITNERKDPFISQATRTGRIRTINQDAQQRLSNLNNTRSGLLTTYDRGISEIEGVISRFTGQLEADRALSVEKLNFLLDEAERQAGAVSETRAREGLRFVPEFLEAKAVVDPFSKEALDIQLQLLEIQKKRDDLAGIVDPEKKRVEELKLEKLEADVAKARGEKTPTEKEIQISTAQTTIDLIESLLDLGVRDTLENVVGTVSSVLPTIRGKSADFERKFEQLQALVAFGNIDKLKGAMSDKDIEFLKQASSGLGLKMSAKGFVKKLEDLQKGVTDGISRKLSRDFNVTESDIANLLKEGTLGEVKTFLEQRSQKKNDKIGTAGNRPQRNLNPGNVKRGGIGDKFAIKNPDGTPKVDDQNHLIFPNEEAGFDALKADLGAKVSGRSRVVTQSDPTISQLGKAYAEDQNWPNAVARLLGVSPDTKTSQIDFDKLVNAVATQEGFFA